MLKWQKGCPLIVDMAPAVGLGTPQGLESIRCVQFGKVIDVPAHSVEVAEARLLEQLRDVVRGGAITDWLRHLVQPVSATWYKATCVHTLAGRQVGRRYEFTDFGSVNGMLRPMQSLDQSDYCLCSCCYPIMATAVIIDGKTHPRVEGSDRFGDDGRIRLEDCPPGTAIQYPDDVRLVVPTCRKD